MLINPQIADSVYVVSDDDASVEGQPPRKYGKVDDVVEIPLPMDIVEIPPLPDDYQTVVIPETYTEQAIHDVEVGVEDADQEFMDWMHEAYRKGKDEDSRWRNDPVGEIKREWKDGVTAIEDSVNDWLSALKGPTASEIQKESRVGDDVEDMEYDVSHPFYKDDQRINRKQKKDPRPKTTSSRKKYKKGDKEDRRSLKVGKRKRKKEIGTEKKKRKKKKTKR
ncbi:P2 [Amphibola crenata associated bacilladnavirus 1]|uniref:p2 n=1 Tax=Amphibola crenata associated bacilladnavirus 1 TaxID=1941435 RepID=A0A1P8YT79_9VIRU|nr:P2 [Amphibola crenata associated bacilladnavirus 1]AQA27287.1 P2 [Amphibola crenata associated bacilladnavirus 1]